MNERARSTTLTGKPWTFEGRQAVWHVETLVGSSLVQADQPRTALAETLGRALAGQRASALVDGAHAAAAQDEIRSAVQRGVPFVLYLIATSPAAHASTDGSGHETVHTLAETGAIVLVARSIQEVVDLGLVARRLAELLLSPVIVVMDREQTADAVQDAFIAEKSAVDQYLGHATDVVTCTTFEERALFGGQRRRVPRMFDVERPAQWGARQPGAIWGRSMAARQAYYQPRVAQEVELQLHEYTALSGRTLEPLLQYRTKDAQTILLAMGSAVETAETVCAFLRGERHKIGVVGVRSLQPFPEPELLQSIVKAKEVLVLERATTGMAGESPLLQRVRAALPSVRSRSAPVVHSVLYGMGGLPLRSTDLAALCQVARAERPPLTYLGIDFLASSSYPKRQVLVDQLRRQHPEVAALGVRAHENLQTGHITMGLFDTDTDLLQQAGRLLQELGLRALRGRPYRPSEHAPQWNVARLSWGKGESLDPGDAAPIDVAVLPSSRMLEDGRWLRDLATDATVLLATSADTNGRPSAARPPDGNTPGRINCFETAARHGAELLGAMVSVLRHHGVALPEGTAIVEAYRRSIGDRDEQDQKACLAAFEVGLQGVRAHETPHATSTTASVGTAGGAATPTNRTTTNRTSTTRQSIRDWSRNDAWFDSLPRFHDQMDVVYQSGDPTELTPDPYLPLGVVPPSTTSFRDRAIGREHIPVIDAHACNGCGMCWQFCPDGAIRAAALPPANLVGWAMTRAQQAGTPADALQRYAGKMNRNVAKSVKQADAALSASQLLRDATAPLADGLETDQRQAVSQAAEAVAVAVDPLPLVRCGDNLLSVSIDPTSCKACGVCVAVCPEKAVTRVPQTSENLSAARRQAALHMTLPETSVEMIVALGETVEQDELASLQLQNVAHAWLTGGDGAEPGSGARLALRSVVATAATLLASHKNAQITQIEVLQNALAERIRGLLSDALPAGDLDVLSAGLQSFGDASVELSSLASRLETATNSGYVDSTRLALFVEAARRIADVRWRLERGLNGFGMAPFSILCLEGEATRWATQFPDNPLRVPVLVDSQGDAESLARGLLAGQIARFTENIRDIRHASRALERPNEAALEPILRKPLTWNDLSPEEKLACPPLLVVADEDEVSEHQLHDLMQLAGADLPVRIVLLAGLSLRRGDPSLTALTQRRAFVAQTSVAFPRHFLRVLKAAFAAPGGAWLRVHAPRPAQHGYASDRTLERATDAVRARALPLYCFDPSRPGVFGARLDLDDNPDVDDAWTLQDNTAYTFAHWALGESRFASQLQPLGDADSKPLPLVEYLQLPAAERQDCTPFIEQNTPHASQRLRVGAALAQATQRRAEIWLTLRELSGIDTPFTEQVRAEADRDASQAFERRQKALEEQHQAQLAAARREVEDKLVAKLEERLTDLAGYQALLTGGDE